jgi:hypothetical protein
MKRKDLIFGLSVAESMPSTAVTGGEFGTGIDSLNTYASKHIVLAGAVGTDLIIKLQESSDDSVYTDVPATQMIGGVNSVTILATGGDNTAVQLGGFNLSRYSRIAVVSGAGTISAVSEVADDLSV